MRVLIACEFSGIVREAFAKLGHDAWSCDLLPTEVAGRHLQTDIMNLRWENWAWDLMIAFPPCTYLASSGARWWHGREKEQDDAIHFIISLMMFPIERICIENPIGIISTRIRKPDQIIQPYQFGHGETKATCLWLRGLSLLQPTNIVDGRIGRVHCEPPSAERWKNRSRTYQGIADAMAEQWGKSTLRGSE